MTVRRHDGGSLLPQLLELLGKLYTGSCVLHTGGYVYAYHKKRDRGTHCRAVVDYGDGLRRLWPSRTCPGKPHQRQLCRGAKYRECGRGSLSTRQRWLADHPHRLWHLCGRHIICNLRTQGNALGQLDLHVHVPMPEMFTQHDLLSPRVVWFVRCTVRGSLYEPQLRSVCQRFRQLPLKRAPHACSS